MVDEEDVSRRRKRMQGYGLVKSELALIIERPDGPKG